METGDQVPAAAIIYRPCSEDSMQIMQDFLREELKITTENRLLGYMYVPHACYHKFERISTASKCKAASQRSTADHPQKR